MPLVDVLIVLIFFFLVSMQFRNLTTLNITLPRIETAGRNEPVEQIEIAISASGEFFFNGSSVTQAELLEGIRVASEVSREIPVLLMADEDSYLKHVTFVMDACRKSGLEKVRIQSR